MIKKAMAQYKRPPITEAVIEIRYETPISQQVIDKLNNRLKKFYPTSIPIASIEISIDKVEATTHKTNNGYKLASADQADILLITSHSMACSRLAPYNGWDAFREKAHSVGQEWKRATGPRKIQRLGVRYINRIDVPIEENPKIAVEDYLKVYPDYPEPAVFSALARYTMQISGPIPDENYELVINSGLVPPPLVDHMSFLLDLDIGLTKDVPQKDDKIWEEIDLMRVHKNRIFEECVTDNARKLFEK